MITSDPSPAVAEAARALELLGLVEVHPQTYVQCANPKDRDFPPRNRHCRGQIYVDQVMDEAGHEYRCPDCERPVFPSTGKQRHPEIRTHVSQPGVQSFVNTRLMNLEVGVKQLADGVFKVDLDGMGVVVCIADHCAEERYLTRDWATITPTCYIVVNPQNLAERFLKEEWITAVLLADIAAGAVDLEETVRRVAKSGSPSMVARASVPIYTKEVLPIMAKPVTPPVPGRRFTVEVGPRAVRIDGLPALAAQADAQFQVFSILRERFLQDLLNGASPDAFRTITLAEIVSELERRQDGTVEDVTSVRRTINRLQEGFEKKIKKGLGLPIDREDVVQTLSWQGQGDEAHGYRINPFTVAIRPFQVDDR
ncbi:MAG: hypothetical protein OEY97_09565 [Nitrospirota bacterium]|nr:hypothetical protein [Nitrospirota bacterium]